jgi:hypothetical protein
MKINGNVAFYLCNELDCGFRYTYKTKSGPSMYRPILNMNVLVVDLNKKVKIQFVGMGSTGYERLLEHGHGGYVFPLNLFNKPYVIDPKPSRNMKEDLHERWLRLIAHNKGVEHVSFRKKYVLVNSEGEVIRSKMCNEEELAETMEFQRGWRERHLGEEPMLWRPAEGKEELEDVGIMYSCQPQQGEFVS